MGQDSNQLVDISTRLESQSIRVFPRQCAKLRHRRSTRTLCADYRPHAGHHPGRAAAS
jgi:hypothetical protein